ncbi:MAG: hypothetical protein GTN43_03630 [Candidatus Aenigmarchaeota archaeon]|nr:hypothetical protein [Candidatus Aenigmarchaeota archaeon]
MGRMRKLSRCPDEDLLGKWRYIFEFNGETYVGEVAKVRRHDLLLSTGEAIKRTVWPYYRVSDKPPQEDIL